MNAPVEMMTVGWREWAILPELGVAAIEVKVDTGARTSAIHTYYLQEEEHPDGLYVRFGLHPDRHQTELALECLARVTDRRAVSDSGGHKEVRYVITTPISMGGQSWPIEITLAQRDNMAYRMLLGRQAMRGRILVNPAASHLLPFSQSEANSGSKSDLQANPNQENEDKITP